MSLSYVSEEADKVGKLFKSRSEREKAKAERKKEREENKEGRQERRKRKGSRVGKIALAPARAAFLGLVSINAFKLGDKLEKGWKKDKSKVEKFWIKFSGKVDVLKGAIEKGSKAHLSGIVGSAAAAAIATATPILIAVASLLKELLIPTDEVDIGIEEGLDEIEINPEFEKGYTKEYIPTDQVAVVPGGTKPPTKEIAPTEKNKTVLVVGTLALIFLLSQ